jgi:uncharacterized protein YndB with AHSA1/START domain
MKQEPIVVERMLNASSDKVWKAITNKEDMKQWYFDIADFQPEVGNEFSFEGGNEGRTYTHLCKITELVQGKKLKYSWRYKGYEGISYVTFELFPEGNKTRLKLTHEGLETFPQDLPDFKKENFVEGWTYLIGTSIKNFVEGAPVEESK